MGEGTNSMITLVDASSLMHRAWHASGHVPADASDIVDHLLERSTSGSDQVLLLFDGGSEKRKAIDPTYKAHRERIPELWNWIVDQQTEWQANGWACAYAAGWEADDLAASAVATMEGPIRLVTSDKDWWMLISDQVHVLRPGDWSLITPQRVQELLGVPTEHLELYKALVGDPSDGIKGVAGVGAKRAAAIIAQEPDPLQWWEEDGSSTIHPRLSGQREQFELSRSLVQLYTDYVHSIHPAPVPGSLADEQLAQDMQGVLWDF
jgi:5'-3' exonuclease